MSQSGTRSGGIGICGLLGVAFVLLKIVGVAPIAAWSWWWVLGPFWIPFTVGLVLVVVMAATGWLK